LLRELNSDSEIYVSDNDARWLSGEEQWAGLVMNSGGTNLGAVRSDSSPIWPAGYVAQKSSDVRANVLANVGSRPADRDATGRRIINDVANGTGHLKNCVGNCVSGAIQVPGGWPNLAMNFRVLNVPSNPQDDDDGDGYNDLLEVLDGNPNTNIYDHDNDGIYDCIDIDIDNDGIWNVNDALPRDHDNDGLNDGIDPDDDNDNILDVDEIGGIWGWYRYDHDNDGIWDMTDLDDDNDGLSDWFEQNDGSNLTGQFDHDNDGLPDFLDDDDDGDGIPDELEN